MSQLPPTAADDQRLPSVLRALRSRNYRLYFAGQGTSLVGTWLTNAATLWLVTELTQGDALILGLVGFASQIPAFLLVAFAGVWVDRTNRRSMLVVTQILSMLQSFALAALALTHVIQVWHVMVLSVCQGLINAFDMPGRQSFLIDIIEAPEDLSNAIALNSSMVNGARILGPTIAGLLIAAVGTGWCFFLDGVSYMAVIASLLLMTLRPSKVKTKHPDMLAALREGASYAFGFPPIRIMLLVVAMVCLVGMPYRILAPIFVTQIYHKQSVAFGLLMAASGLGALLGAIYLASRKSVVGLGRVVVIATVIFGAALIAFAFTQVLWMGMIAMVVVGLGMMIHMAAVNTLLQTVVDDDKRGRVMSYYTMMFMGATPFGSLIAGALAQRIGAPWTVAIGGMICIGAGGLFMSKLPQIRVLLRFPIYVRKGILREAAAGVNMATELMTPPEDQG